MGVPITDILSRKEISVPDIYGKVIAVDAYNHIYQFLSTIRQRDGTPLMDSKGGITSHLSGLFSRTANLMERNVRLVYVFDGKAPDMKRTEQERRQKAKQKAEAKYKIAVQKEYGKIFGMVFFWDPRSLPTVSSPNTCPRGNGELGKNTTP